MRTTPPAPLVCPLCRYARPARYYHGGHTWICQMCDYQEDATETLQAWRTRLNVKLGRPAAWKHYGETNHD